MCSNYFNYDLYVRLFPDSEWHFVVSGRVRAKSYMAYEQYLEKLRKLLNKDSVYQFKVASCYDEAKARNIQLGLFF